LKYIRPLKNSDTNIGGKARGLQVLLNKNHHVPETYVCILEAYKKWLETGNIILEDLKEELNQVIQNDKDYIVRSSATLEDSPDHSYAGQLMSIPKVRGTDRILNSIVTVWESASSNSIKEYSIRKGIGQEIGVAVIIQEMLDPKFSGVVFTKNPINGIDEIIIEIVSGSSDKLLQEGIDPERWIYRWDKFVEKPEKHLIDEKIVQKIAKTSKKMEVSLSVPLDLEWIYYNDKIWWIQLREITTIDELDYYSNKISSEQLPGLIKPLIWSINIPLVCGSWINLLEEMIGTTSLKPSDMAKQFYYRAYYNMSKLGKAFEIIGIPRDSLEILMRGEKDASIKPKPPLRLYPRLLKFSVDKFFYERKLKAHLKKSKTAIKKFETQRVSNSKEALLVIDELFQYNQEASYYVIISQLLHSIFHQLFSRTHKNDISNLELEPEISSINPNYFLSKLSQQISISEIEELTIQKILDNENLSLKYLDFINRFGHLSDSGNDFSEPTWSDTPEHVLSLIKYQAKTHVNLSKKRIFKSGKSRLYRKVIRLYELREKISFNYTKSYGLFRKYFLIIAKDLVNRGILEEESDIFFLTYTQIQKLVITSSIEVIKNSIRDIKQEMEQMEHVFPPSEIYGEDPPPVLSKNIDTTIFKGIAASKGYYKGIIKHVKTFNEFDQVEPGEILVIPFSDISWLPILSKAGAIISESGGILSHAAVIAREYEIPAILGVKNTHNLPDGSHVLIDGFKGLIQMIEKN
jgi:pyruvate,water dikinase